MHLIALVFGMCLTLGFVAVVWAVTRITTKWLEARVCTAQTVLATQQLEFNQKQHQAMVSLRREQMDRMGSPFSGMGPRSRNDEPDHH